MNFKSDKNRNNLNSHIHDKGLPHSTCYKIIGEKESKGGGAATGEVYIWDEMLKI